MACEVDHDECGCDLGGLSTLPETGTITAFSKDRRTNADLIAHLVELRHLHDGMDVIDLTYGKGRFWSKYRPPRLTTNDLDPQSAAAHHFDFRYPPARMFLSFDFAVIDPPYGLRGTINETNGDYGLGEYLSVADRHEMMHAGLCGAVFVTKPGGHILYKCQLQTCNGRKYHQPHMVYNWAMDEGLEFVSELHVHSHRAQPAGRRQVMVHQNYSTALLFRQPW